MTQTPTATSDTAPVSGGSIARVALLVLIVLVPLGALGYIYWDFQRTGGIQALPDGYKLVDLKAMTTFDFDQQNGTAAQIPDRWRALDGEKVVLEGEMFTSRSATGTVDSFDLVYSIANCCYGSEPQVQHFVKSEAIGDPVKFYRVPVRAKGTLRVDVQKSEGRVASVFHLDVEDVEPLG